MRETAGRGDGSAAVVFVAELAVEQHVGAHAEDPVARPRALAQQIRRRQADRRTAGADQERRDRHVQPIEQSGGEERRHRHATALDEEPRATAPAQVLHQLGEVETAGTLVHAEDVGGAEAVLPRAMRVRPHT